MPIGILSDSEFVSELNHSTIHELKRGRGPVAEKPDNVRAFIARESLNGASAKEISENFNISPSSISAYKNGATSTATYNEPNGRLNKKINEVKESIAKRASRKLTKALNGISDDKLAELNGKDLSSVAKDMAVIIDKMSPKVESIDTSHLHLHLYRPRMKEVDEYEVIDVESTR